MNSIPYLVPEPLAFWPKFVSGRKLCDQSMGNFKLDSFLYYLVSVGSEYCIRLFLCANSQTHTHIDTASLWLLRNTGNGTVPVPKPLEIWNPGSDAFMAESKRPIRTLCLPTPPPPPLAFVKHFFPFFWFFFVFIFFLRGGGELQMPTVGQGRGRGRVERKLLSTLPPSVDYG